MKFVFSLTRTKPFTDSRPNSEPRRLSLDLLDCQADVFLIFGGGPLRGLIVS